MSNQSNIKEGLIQITKSKPMTYQLLRFLVDNNCVIKVDRELPDIEQVFANTANLPKEVHKNVLGDKWKFINAVRKSLAGYVAVESIIEEAK